MTSAVRSARTAAPKSRVCRYFAPSAPGEPAMVEIIEHKGRKAEVKHYWLAEFPATGGRGFRWETFTGCVRPGEDGVYCVLVADDGAHQCDCKGHAAHGHRTVCKHVAATLALVAAGRFGEA